METAAETMGAEIAAVESTSVVPVVGQVLAIGATVALTVKTVMDLVRQASIAKATATDWARNVQSEINSIIHAYKAYQATTLIPSLLLGSSTAVIAKYKEAMNAIGKELQKLEALRKAGHTIWVRSSGAVGQTTRITLHGGSWNTLKQFIDIMVNLGIFESGVVGIGSYHSGVFGQTQFYAFRNLKVRTGMGSQLSALLNKLTGVFGTTGTGNGAAGTYKPTPLENALKQQLAQQGIINALTAQSGTITAAQTGKMTQAIVVSGTVTGNPEGDWLSELLNRVAGNLRTTFRDWLKQLAKSLGMLGAGLVVEEFLEGREEDEDQKKKRRPKRRHNNKKKKKKKKPPKDFQVATTIVAKRSEWLQKVTFTLSQRKPLDNDNRGILTFYTKTGSTIVFKNVYRGTFSVIALVHGTGLRIWRQFRRYRERIVNKPSNPNRKKPVVKSWFIPRITAADRKLAIPEEINSGLVKYK